ncbi:coenzyme F420 hydrogenase maturation protease [Klebsiella pneumoniae subsp. pneumoniae]|nr:coenzyme F420 hydrogenase maturation protease [Klebsiella pneumoniae subsp. pneumoniae]
MTDVLLCVGNSMMGDDGAGPLLAEMCAANPAGQWVVIDGGSAPENDIVAIRELRPERLLIVDATDMGLNPGDIRIIDPDDIAEMFMMTTHNMPLNYLVDQLKEDVGEVIFLGIQPDIVGFYYPMTQPVKEAVAPGVSAAGRLAGQGRLYSAGGRGRLALRRTGLSAGARLAGREPRSRRCQLKILYH